MSATREPDDGPFHFEHVEVNCAKRNCNALVMRPKAPIVFGSARQEALSLPASLSPVERRILDRVARRRAGTPILILRGGDDDGRRLWSFDRRYDEDELEEVGKAFSRSVLPMYRGLLARGIVLFIHSDWGHREIGPIRRGLNALAETLGAVQSDPRLLAVDRWIIRNMLLYSSLSVGHVLEQLLFAHLGLLERRGERIARMLHGLPVDRVA